MRAIVEDVRKHLPDMVQALQQLPPLVENAIQRARDGRFSVPVTTQDLERLRLQIRRDGRRRDVALLTATCALGGIIWLALATAPDVAWLRAARVSASSGCWSGCVGRLPASDSSPHTTGSTDTTTMPIVTMPKFSLMIGTLPNR